MKNLKWTPFNEELNVGIYILQADYRFGNAHRGNFFYSENARHKEGAGELVRQQQTYENEFVKFDCYCLEWE